MTTHPDGANPQHAWAFRGIRPNQPNGANRAHNPQVAGTNPAPAISLIAATGAAASASRIVAQLISCTAWEVAIGPAARRTSSAVIAAV
jgi:hypothetical protein